MKLHDGLLSGLPEGEVLEVRIGLHWTAVVTRVNNVERCGLASTLAKEHVHGAEPDVPAAGQLTGLGAKTLAGFIRERHQPTLASIGVAALNALLPPPPPSSWIAGNAEEILAVRGQGKRVAMIGRFPFTTRLREQVGELLVIDRQAGQDVLPEAAASEVLPAAEVIAITAMALVNHTLEELLELCPAHAEVMLLGPSTPFSPALFEAGIALLSGAIVREIQPVLQAVSQAANFRQVHRAGVELVTIGRA